MSIVLRENEWAEHMLEARSLGRKPSETLRRIARYYIDNGYKKSEVRKKMDIFLLQCNQKASLTNWSDALDWAVSYALKHEAINIQSIPISKPEMEIIRNISGRQAQRLAFTLLCLAKYWHEIGSGSEYWVNTKDNEIMNMANINTSVKRQCALYKMLRDNKLIDFSKMVDNTNVKVNFVTDGDEVMSVSDFRNLGNQYLRYIGEPYFECANCGITVKYKDPKRGRKQKYCPDCAAEIAIQQRVNYAMRSRDPKYV